jgi:hypothetical protein
MARLNDDAQWIVLMGFIVSFSFFFLAIVVNQSTVLGQTTPESVIEFPKNDIRDVRSVILQPGTIRNPSYSPSVVINRDITTIALNRKNAVVFYTDPQSCIDNEYTCIEIHYNNGVTAYNESWVSP